MNPFLDAGLRAQVEILKRLYPEEFNRAVSAMSGRTREGQVEWLREIAGEKGIDLDALARRYGVTL